jgi:serine/threonine-protein kinase RsbW
MTNPNTKSYELLLPGDPASLSIVRWIVTELAREAGLASTDIDRIEMAVDEACTNVLDHAYKFQQPKPPLHIEIARSEEHFVVDVLDEGETLNLDNYVEPKFPDHWNEGHVRGVGLYLIHKLMDKVEYVQLPNQHNRMRLIKHVNRSQTGSVNGLCQPEA